MTEQERPGDRTRTIVVGSSSPLAIALGQLWRATAERDGHQFRTVGITRATAPGARDRPGQNPFLVEELVGDAADPDDAARMVARAVEVLGGIDVMVLAAGAMPIAPLRDTDAQMWRRAFAGCVDAAFFPIRAAEPHLTRGASLVITTSVNARHPVPHVTAYAAAKAAAEGLTRALAVELGHRGIRVNAVAPGLMPGPTESVGPDRLAGYPLGQVVRTSEAAAVIALLASPAGGGVNGAVVPVDGGFSVVAASVEGRDDLRRKFHQG